MTTTHRLAEADAAFGAAMNGRRFDRKTTAILQAPATNRSPAAAALPADPHFLHLGDLTNGGAAGLNLAKLIGSRCVIQGSSGAGKSMLLRRLFEQAFGRVQQLVIDPDGEFASLAEKFDVAVLTAAEITRIGGTALGQHIRAHRYSAVLDLSDIDDTERLQIVSDLTTALFDAPREHWHPMLVLIDEVQNLAPYYDDGVIPPDIRKRTIMALAQLMGRGRKRGLSGVLATQRLAETAKAVTSKAINTVVGRTVFDRDLHRSGAALGFTAGHSQQIRSLADGEFIAAGPAFGPHRLRFKASKTLSTHRGATPEVTPPPALSAAAAAALLREMPAAPLPPVAAVGSTLRKVSHGKWAAGEDAIITQGYQSGHTLTAIAAALVAAGFRMRSVSGISVRAGVLGLVSALAASRWSPHEDQIIIEQYGAGARISAIREALAAARYDRGYNAIQARAVHLNVTEDRVNYWTDEENAIAIAGLKAGKPQREIIADLRAAGFERGVTAISKFAQKHNFNRGHAPWTEQEVDAVRQGYTAKKPPAEIATQIGRPVSTVRNKASEMGLKLRTPWSPKERQILIDACKSKQTLISAAEQIGRPYQNVAAEASRMKLSFRHTATKS